MKDDRQRLLDIRECIRKIEKYAVRGRKAVENDELVRNWIVHHLQIIGEASRALSADFRKQHPEVPWSKAIGMRNILVHHYFAEDVAVIWWAVERDLPDLKQKIEGILQEQEDEA